MSSFDEYRKKLTGKYGSKPKKTEDEQEKTHIDGASVWDDSFESTRKEMTARYGGGVDFSKVKEWFTESDSILKNMSDYYTANDGKWVSNYGGDFTDKINELLNLSSAVGYYVRNNRKEFSDYDSVSKALSEYRSALEQYQKQNSSLSQFYSQFGSEDEYNSWYEWYKKEQEYQKYFENVDPTKASQGFEKYLSDQETANNVLKNDLDNNGKEDWWEKALGYLAGDGGGVVDTTLPTAGVTQTVHDLRADESYRRPGDDWSEEQKNAFGQLYGISPSLAYDFAEETNRRNKNATEEAALKKIAESATSDFWAGLGHTFGAIVTAPFGLVDTLSDLAMGAAGRPIESDGFVSPFEYSQAVTSGISTHLNEKSGTLNENIPLIGGKGLGDVYGLGTSIAQSMASAYTLGSAGTLISYFGQGAASGIDDALSRGASDGQAVLYGISLGVFEGLAEMAGVDNLFKLGASSTVKGFITNILKQAGAEGMEEGLTSLLSNIADNAIMQDKSNFNALVKQYMAQGMSESDAKKKAWMDSVEGIAFDTIAGAVSGGVSGSLHTIKQNIRQSSSAKKAFGNNPQALLNDAFEADPDNAYAKKMQERLNSGKKLSGNQLYQLYAESDQTFRSQDISKMTSATKARLTQLGETGDVTKLAEALVKQASGEELSSKERSLISSSKFGRRVANELSPANIKSGRYTSEWAEGIRTKRINADVYNRSLYDLASEQAGVAVATEEDSVGKNLTEKENATEAKFGVSTDGKTRIGDMEVSIKEIASVKDGEVTLRLEDGSTVNAMDVEFGSHEEMRLYDSVASMNLNAASANAFINGYDHSMDVQEYALGFREAYRYGEYGFPVKQMSTKGFSANLSEAQRTLAYDLGKTDTKYKIEARQNAIAEKSSEVAPKKVGKVHYAEGINMESLTQRQQASLKGLESLATALGVEIHIFESQVVDGKRQGANGWFDRSDGSIHLDLHAGLNGEGTMLFTASHELTHFIREWNPSKFKVFADSLLEEYGNKDVSVETLVSEQIAKAKRNGRDIDYDTAYEEVIADSCEAMLADGDIIGKIAKLKAKDKSLWEKIKDFITDLVAKIKAAYEGMTPDSVEGRFVSEMLDKMENLKALWTDALVEASDAYTASDFVEIDATTESVAPNMFSERTWTESDYVVYRDKMAEKIAKALDVSVQKAKSYIDDINSIAKLIADDRARLDYEASSFGSAFVSNVEYGGSFDYTTLCKKRRIYTGTFTEIQKRLKDVALTPDDILTIRNLMLEEGIEATCGLCYVEGSRANMGKFAKEFIRLYKRDNPLAWIPNMADVNTPDGVEQMRISHPEAYDQYVYFWNHYGKLKDSDPALFASQQKPKLYEARKEYKGEILEHFKGDSTVAKKNRNGGIRMQSFSDFEIVHLIDTMQVIMDMSTVGLAGQAYTKVPEFAKAFGNTGLKINLSLIAKGVDADGNLIFDDREGMPHKTAFDLRDRYSKNVGTIIVTFTDQQLLAAMADPRIDFIIPFHRSQWKKGQYGAMGLPKGTKDYTFMRNEKLIKKTYHEYRGRMVLDKASNYMPNEYWDFSKSGKENAEAYLKMCAENNKRPKFYKLLDYDGKGAYSLKKDGSTDGYWKLLIDFKMYDNDGVGSPQMAVTPTFNMDEANTMLDEYKGGHSKYPVASSVVDTFVEKYNKDNGTKYSDRDSDGKTLSNGQQEFLKDSKIRDKNGNILVCYHATEADFTIFDKAKIGSGNGGASFGTGFYFTPNRSLSEDYGGNVGQYYLNIENPFEYYTVDKGYIVDMLEKSGYEYDKDFVDSYDAEDLWEDDLIDNFLGKALFGKNPYAEFSKMLQNAGFDGIWAGSEIIAFEPNQIKRTDNLTPTSDPDIRYSLREYTDKQKENWKNAKRIVLYDNEVQFRDFINKARNDKNYDKKMYFGAIPTDLATLIKAETGIDVENFNCSLSAYEIKKIFKDHGDESKEAPRGQRAITEADIMNIPIVIQSPETIKLSTKKYEGKPVIEFSKQTNGTLTVAAVVSDKHLDLFVQTAYVGIKKGNLSTPIGEQAPINTPEASGGTVSDISISQDLESVNTQSEKSLLSDRDTDSVSNRSLLANALESVAQNDIERGKLKQYKEKIALIESEQAKLAEIRAKIKELSFAKGARDTQAIKSLQFEANQAANRINTYDKQLLNLESTKALKDVLQREKEMAYKRAEKRGKEALSAYREKAAKTQRELMTRYQESRKKNVEGRKQTAMRHKIKDVVSELNQYLLKGTKDKHVPIELQKAVAEALYAVNMDTVGAEERIAKLESELMKAKTPEAIKEISRKIDHIREMGERMDGKLQSLKNAYDDIVNSNDPLIANSHDEVISNTIDKVIKEVGSTPLRDMTLAQLESVYDMYKMVLTTIRNTNKAFKAAKSEEISVIANRVMEEIDGLGKKKPYRTKVSQALSKFDWNNLKPVYAFDRIGSNTFTEVFNNVRAGEDTWAVDITEAKNFSLDQRKKFKYDSWDFKKRYGFTSSSGMHFELSLDQIMSIYAYSKREQAKDHLKKGGIVIDETTEVTVKNKLGIPVKFNPTEATAYNLSDETLAAIIGKLTTEQMAFVDVMQDYLSTTMGDKGNEVSLALYGIKLYKEKHYFPLKSAQQFMAKAKEQQKGEVKIKNSGFSKETVTKASNPIVLTPFMDVWADHVNEMSMYHAFVLPLEDFYRVYNYKTPTSDTMATESVEMFLQNSYGKGATQYIDQLLKDLNGGARVDPTAGIINKLTGLFKKSAVFASLSVVVQQPSAIARATALVDTKYFAGIPSGKHSETWAEVKKYAPVAVIKEMGYFDTGMGQSTVEWIKDEKTWKDKLDDIASKAPAFADELAWCSIWKAVKRETLNTHKDLKPNSEEFLKAVGERFTEVVTKTQVYDSVLSRSAYMRSKDTGVKMATAFMGEPTTSINMLENALIQGKRGNKRYACKAVGSVVASMILNSILVSFVYAGRDDDEEKTYTEKYISTLTEELIDSFNPLTLIPFFKDIVSIAQGYDVERSDMAVITDIVKAWNNLENDNRSVYRKVEDFAGAIASLFGLPVKNIMRDARGMYNTVNSFINGEKTTGAGIGAAVTEAITGKEKSNGQLLYDAIISGNTEQANRVKGRFEDQKAIDSAIRKALRDNDSRIKQAAEARYNGDIAEYMRIAKAIIAEGNFSQDNIVSAINSEINTLKKGEGTSESTTSNKVKSMYEMSDYYSALEGRDQATAYVVKEDLIKTDMANGKDREEAEADFNSKFASHLRDLYDAGDISDSKAEDMLVSYGGKTEEEAFSKVQYWEFRKQHPDYDLSEEAVTKYYNDVEPSGIGIDVYYDYSKQRSKCKGTDSDGDGKTDSGSVKSEVLYVIDSLPITNAQKDVLYYLNGWAQSTIRQAPWH